MKLISKDQIVQLDPDKVGNKAFAGCLLVVTDVKEWGVMGYVQALGNRDAMGGRAYYRAQWHEISDALGYAQWLVSDHDS